MSDIDERVTISVTVNGQEVQIDRSEKPQFMVDGDYEMSQLFGACSLMAHMAKALTTISQKPEDTIDKMAQFAKRLL